MAGTLVDIRKSVVDVTGRNDLVVDTTAYADKIGRAHV